MIFMPTSDHNNASLHSLYTIAHHGHKPARLHVVQPSISQPGTFLPGAYLGCHQFAMNSTTTEYVRPDDDMPGFEIQLMPTGLFWLTVQVSLRPGAASPNLYFSWAEAAIMAGVTGNNEDIVAS